MTGVTFQDKETMMTIDLTRYRQARMLELYSSRAIITDPEGSHEIFERGGIRVPEWLELWVSTISDTTPNKPKHIKRAEESIGPVIMAPELAISEVGAIWVEVLTTSTLNIMIDHNTYGDLMVPVWTGYTYSGQFLIAWADEYD